VPSVASDAQGQRQPFEARRYRVLLAALTVLSDGADRGRLQWQLSALLDALVNEAAEAGVSIDLTDGDDRRRVVRDVLTALVDELGILLHQDGERDPLASERWRERGALYELDEDALDRLIALPDLFDSVQEAIDVARRPLQVSGQPRLTARLTLMARLLEEPVVYADEIDDGQADVLSRDGRQMIAGLTGTAYSLAELFGLQPEYRQEGVCLIDGAEETTDPADRFPARSKDRQCALLLAAHLARSPRLGPAAQRSALAALIRDYARSWSIDPSDSHQVAALADDAGQVLIGMRLARREADGTLVALPAVARFADLELRTDSDAVIPLFS